MYQFRITGSPRHKWSLQSFTNLTNSLPFRPSPGAHGKDWCKGGDWNECPRVMQVCRWSSAITAVHAGRTALLQLKPQP